MTLFGQLQVLPNLSLRFNCSLFLVCRVSVTFINCSTLSPMVWALSNLPHAKKLNMYALLSAFLSLLLEAGEIFNCRSHTHTHTLRGRHQNYRWTKKKLRLSPPNSGGVGGVGISLRKQLTNPSYQDFLFVSDFLPSLIFNHRALKGSMESCNIKPITNSGHYRPMVKLST